MLKQGLIWKRIKVWEKEQIIVLDKYWDYQWIDIPKRVF